MNKTLILIDGSSFIFRAFHAMPNLSSPDKKPTGATYGVINMLKQMLKKYNTINWCCVFDAPGKTFRHNIFPEYKANRLDTPSELIPQFEDIYTITPALGIPIIIEYGVEADDVIGTIAIKAANSGYKVLIATGDKDFAQLVNENITLINTMNNELLDINGVIDKFNVKPTQIVDYLSLIGDKIDNIPGVEKCGPKTASKWLNEYQSLDNIVSNAHKISGVVGENLRNSLQFLPIAKNLITIRTNLDLSHIIPNGVEQLILCTENKNLLANTYATLGFKTWLRQINEEISNTDSNNNSLYPTHQIIIKQSNNKKVIHITNKLQLQSIIQQLIINNNPIAIHISHVKNHQAQLEHIVFADDNNVYIVIIENHPINTNLFDNIDNSHNQTYDYLPEISQLLSSVIPKIFINYKENLATCKQNNIPINHVIGDLTLAHYILNSKAPHNFEYIYKEFANINVYPLNSKAKQTLDNQTNINNLIEIVENTKVVYETIVNNLTNEELSLYKNTELALVPVLVDIEYAGIKLDVYKLKLLEQEISKKLQILEDNIYQNVGSVFNINSPKQLQDVLFNNLKLPTTRIKKNKTNGYSTDEESLIHLQAQGIQLATLLIEYRGLSKLLNTYITKLPQLVDNNSKLHTTFEQAQVTSGRLSSREPNLQNIPIKNTWGRRIRQCFIASDNNHVLICADYSQIELRILAHFSQDQNLITAFNTSQDVHSITASEIFHKPIDTITKDERRYAKTINFSLLYGKTIFGLANELNIDRVTAKQYIDTYFAKYPNVLSYLEKIKEFARMNGYVNTLFGRKIYLPNINSTNKIIREAEERVALNAPMQGTSADIIKIAMCRIYQWLKQNNLHSKIILQVHDELIFDVPLNEIDIIKCHLNQLMCDGFNNLSVKLTTEIKIANNWDDAH